MQTTTKYMNKEDIIRLNDKAIERDYNATIHPDFYDDILKDGIKYPIDRAFLHNPDAPDGGEMRVAISYPKPYGVYLPYSIDGGHWESDMGRALLDMTPEDYESLPTVNIHDA